MKMDPNVSSTSLYPFWDAINILILRGEDRKGWRKIDGTHHGMNVHGRRLTSKDRAIGVTPLALMASQKLALRYTYISLLRVFRTRVWGVFALNPETGVCGHTQGKHQLRPDWPRCI